MIEEDPDYKHWKESKVKWIPKLFNQIVLEPYSLNIIFGPRQVGKTILLKLIIKDLLDKNVNPRSIFYLNCNEFNDFQELDSAIDEYIKIKKVNNVNNAFIFLDEVTVPHQWYRAIRYRIDRGDFKNDVLILTQSISMYAKREVETFHGRRGKGKDYVMYPLSFSDFFEIAKKAQIARPIKNMKELFLNAKDMYSKLGELNELFKLYIKYGGFPMAAKLAILNEKMPHELISSYINYLKRDFVKLKIEESIVKDMLKAILERASSRISLKRIAKEFDISAHKLFFRYLAIFEDLLLLKQLYYIDPDTCYPNYLKQRKVYLMDPLLYAVFAEWCNAKRSSFDVIVESVIASHLSRIYKIIGYLENSRELDIVVKSNNELIGFIIDHEEKRLTYTPFVKIKEIITLSSEKFDLNDKIIPIPLFTVLI